MGILSRNKNTLPEKIGKEPNAKYAVVFVPGLGGGRETWYTFSKLLKEEWTRHKTFDLKYFHFAEEDNWFIKFCGIDSRLKFLARVIGGVEINQLAKGLDSYLEVNCYKYEKVILVGHSMGGLISRRCIVNQIKKAYSTPITKLVTYASPHLGSLIANRIGLTLQIRQMWYYKSDFLNELNKEWNTLSAQSYVNPTYVIAEKDRVVDHESAKGSDIEDPHTIWASGQNHSSIINPKQTDHIGYAALIKILNDIDEEEGGLDDGNFLDDFEDEFEA